MAASESVSFNITGDSSSAQRAFKGAATEAATASRAAKQLADMLGIQSRTAIASAKATETLSKSDKILRDAELELSGAADEARKQLQKQGTAAADAAVKTGLAGAAASEAGGGLGAMGGAMGALVGAGVALSPVLVTVGAGLGGLGLAALSTTRNTKEMHQFLAPLKTDLSQFSASLQPEVLGLFGEGVKIAGTALHDLQPVSAATGKALEGVLGEIGAGANSAQFRSFFTWMGQQAGPDVAQLGGVVIDLAKDIPPLLKELQPVASLLLGVTDGTLKAVGALEKFHVLLPVIGIAAGALAGSPIGALVGGLAGLTAEAASANDELGKTGLNLDHLTPKYTAVSRQMVNYADVAGIVAANLKAGAVPEALAASAGDKLAAAFANAATNTSTLDTRWNILVGDFNGAQGAVIAAEQAVASYGQAVKQSGSRSLTAQAAFYSTVSSIQAMVDAEAKNHAPARQVYNDIQAQIDALKRKGPLNAAERADLNRLQGAADAFANSTLGLNKQLLTAAGTVQNKFTANLLALGRDTPGINRDVSNLSNAILQTGTRSQATQGDRARLIKDLEGAGYSAKGATKLVDGLEKKISNLRGKNVNVNVNATGTGGALVKASGIASRTFHLEHLGVAGAAGGMKVTAGTGPTADDVPVLVSKGETIVSAAHSKKLAGAFRALGVPGYAAGGTPAGLVDFAAGQEASWVGSQEASWVNGTLSALAKQFKAQAAASGALPHGSIPGLLGEVQFAASLLSSHGWSNNQITPLELLWTRESGWNPWAVNPQSGAAGIPQALGHGHVFNLGDAKAQIAWGENYIKQVYGSPAAAWAHEVSAGWYDKGGYLPTGLSLAYNGTGRPEPVIPAGRGGTGGAPVQVNVTINGPVGSQHELDTWLRNGVDRLAKNGSLTYALRHSPSAK